jgi:hypothetical protein
MAVVVLASCEKHDEKPVLPATPDAVSVTWSMARDATGLALTYEVENRTAAPIWILDQLVTTSRDGMMVLPDRVIVRRGPDATTAGFALGFVEQLGHAVEVTPAPVARALAAGAKLGGTKHVPLPLASWHPYDSMIDKLEGTPSKAMLLVSWLPEKPASKQPGWQDVPAAGGGTLHLPTRSFFGVSAQWTRGATLAIP